MTEEETLAALWEIATYFAELDPIMYDSMDQRWCLGCKSQAIYTEDFEHEPSCIVLKARALVDRAHLPVPYKAPE